MTRKRFPLLSLALAAALAMPVLANGTQTAHADVTVRVRGNVKVKVGPQRRVRRVRVRHRRHRTHQPRVRLRVGGGVYYGGGVYIGRRFADPPPPPVVYDYECYTPPVRTYYAAPPRPPAPPVAVVAAPPPPLPRLGIGVFAGGVQVRGDRNSETSDVGLFARLRLTDRLLLEGEIAQSEIEDVREDRRFGGALVYDVRPRSRFSLQLIGGLGVTQVEMGDGAWETNQEYGELGLGLSLRLSRHLTLAGDVRSGVRARVDGAPSDNALKAVAPSEEEEEQYVRGRLSLMLSF